MSLRFTKTLAATAALAMAGSASGQSPVASYNAPNLDAIPTVSTAGAFNITVAGDGDAEVITTMVQVFFIPGDGATGPTAIGGLLLIDDGTGAGANGNAIDANENGTYGDALQDTDVDGFNVDLSLTLAATLTQLEANITAARGAAGSSGAVFLQFTFTDAGDDAQTTENPLTFTTATGAFTAAGTHESPVVLEGGLTISNAFIDVANNQLILEFPVPIALAGTNTNGTIVANVSAADLEVDDANDFVGAASPTALTGNPVIGGASNQTLTFTFDTTVMSPDIPSVGEFVRGIGTDIEDSFGRRANGDTNGSVITALVNLAVANANWLQSVDANNANVTDAFSVQFNLPVDPANPGDQDFYRMIFMGETIGAATDLVQAGGFVITNIAVDTTVDATGATVVMDVNSDVDSVGVAANGRNDDDATGVDSGFEAVNTNGDESQLTHQLVSEVDTGTQPMSTLGTAYLGGTAGTSETTTIGDMIAPTFIAVAFLDEDGDGTLDAIAAIADEALAASTSNGGVTIQALDAAMVQPLANIDAITGALPDPIELMFTGDNDIAITVFDTAVGSLDPDLGVTGQTALETNNAVIFSNLDLSGIGTDLPGTGDADIFDFAYDATMGSFTDASANTNPVGTFAAANADEDRAGPLLVMSWHLTSDNIPNIDLASSNIQCFAEDVNNGVGDSVDDRAVFSFSETMAAPSNGDVQNINFDGVLLSDGPNPVSFLDDSRITTPDLSNTVTVVDDNFNALPTGDFIIAQNASLDDTAGNFFTGSGSLVSGTDPFLPLATGGGWTAFLIDADVAGDPGFGFADSALIFMNADLDPTLLDDTAEQTARGADFGLTGFTFMPESVALSAGSMNILDLQFGSANDGLVSMTSTQTITYMGTSATTLLTGGAKDSPFDVAEPSQPAVNTETPFVMSIVGNITMNGQPAPIGTQITGMIAIPTVRSINADKDGLTFRYDRADIDQGENPSSTVDPITRSLEDFTNFLLGLEEAVYLLCDANNIDIYSNTKFFLQKNNTDNEGFPDDAGADFVSIDLDVNASNLDRISFSGRTSDNNVSSGSVTLCYDVLRSVSGTFGSLFDDGYCIGGVPIKSEAIVTNTTGGYALYVSMPNLEASDSDDGIGSDGNIFATENLPVIILVTTPDGTVFPCSGLVNNINGTGSILFSTDILTQNSDGSATGALTFDINLDNVGNEMAYDGYNIVGFPRASGFAEASNDLPVLPDGVLEDDVVLGDSLLPSAGPEDQFVWWDDDGDGIFESGEINTIVVDNDCITSFPFVINSEGVQLGTGGVRAICGGYSFGMYVDDSYGCAQFGTPLNETGLFTGNDNEFPNNSANDGWAFVTVSSDFATMADFFTANPDVDLVIFFNRTSNTDVSVSSASPAGGPTSGNNLTSLDSGDAIIIHTNN